MFRFLPLAIFSMVAMFGVLLYWAEAFSSPLFAEKLAISDSEEENLVRDDWKEALSDGEKINLTDSDIDYLTEGKEYNPDSVVVVLNKGLSTPKISSLAEKHHSELPMNLQDTQESVTDETYISLKVPDNTTVENFLKELNADNNVLFAEPSYKRTLSWTPNDPSFVSQWQLQNISAGNYGIEMPKAWDYVFSKTGAYGGSDSVIVAVIDTGLAFEDRTVNRPGTYEDTWDFDPLPDLPINIWTNSGEIPGNNRDDDLNGFIDDYRGVNIDDYYNYETTYKGIIWGHTFEDGYPDDDHGHGTHVSSIIAANTNNATAASGIAFNVQIMPIKIFDYNGSVWSESVIDSLAYAIANGADVINMSFGGSSPSTIEESLIDEAVRQGIIPVAASGNSGNKIIQYPAGYKNVIAVGASNPNGTRSSYSTCGDWLDLSAPVGAEGTGNGFLEQNYQCYNSATRANPLPCTRDGSTPQIYFPGTGTPNSFKTFSEGTSMGTSFASPQVAAVAALLKSIEPNITFAEARYKLRNGATEIGGVRYSEALGYGILNAYNTLTLDLPVGNYKPVYRFWSDRYRHHFYTISLEERDTVIKTLSHDWTYEGIAYYAADVCPQGFSALYRFWSPVYRGHFYTISSAERDYVINNLAHDWTYEGTAFCASPAARPDLTAVYRFWSDRYRGHFYTISSVERDYVIQNLSHDWKYEGIAFYVSSNNSPLLDP